MVFLGSFVVRLILSGGFGWFVQQHMRIPLATAAVVLLTFGVYELLTSGRSQRPEPDHDHDHNHDHDHDHDHDHNGDLDVFENNHDPAELAFFDYTHNHADLTFLDDPQPEHDHHGGNAGPRIGWLLLAPLLVLILVAPTGLGAAAAQRVDAYVPVEASEEFTSLDEPGDLIPGPDSATPASGDPGSQSGGDPSQDPSLLESAEAAGFGDSAEAGDPGEPIDPNVPVEMRIYEFLDRAVWDEERSLEGRVVRLEGLVVNDPAIADGFRLTRFLVSCCAADGIPLQVVVRGVDGSFADDTWVVADLVWHPPEIPYRDQERPWDVEADAVTITLRPGGAPTNPYESPY
jgi:uncharacterized repeat protein (TIGR03943 family)